MKARARAAEELGILYNTGEGGLYEDLYKYGKSIIVQVAQAASSPPDYATAARPLRSRWARAKTGIGGHLRARKSLETRLAPDDPRGSDAISPAPHHDLPIEDLRQLVYSHEATNHTKPVIVKIAAVHNGADSKRNCSKRRGHHRHRRFSRRNGAAPTRIRDHVGIPIELALASVDKRLRDEGIRDNVAIVVGGSIRSSADIIKAVALGADCVYIATAALLALGCHLCRSCHTGKCNWGIATQIPELVKRLNPDIGYKRLVNLMKAWQHEIKEMMGGMGINPSKA